MRHEICVHYCDNTSYMRVLLCNLFDSSICFRLCCGRRGLLKNWNTAGSPHCKNEQAIIKRWCQARKQAGNSGQRVSCQEMNICISTFPTCFAKSLALRPSLLLHAQSLSLSPSFSRNCCFFIIVITAMFSLDTLFWIRMCKLWQMSNYRQDKAQVQHRTSSRAALSI